MRWIITQRWVLKKVAQKRYCELKSDAKLDKEIKEDVLAFRAVRGIERKFFINALLNDRKFSNIKFRIEHYFFPLLSRLKVYNNRGRKSVAKINDVLETSVKEGYLIPFGYYEEEEIQRLKLTRKGYKYISRFYYLSAFYNNQHIQQIITVLIQWGIPLLALWILSQFFNISISKSN